MEKAFVSTCVFAALISMTMLLVQANETVRALSLPTREPALEGIKLSCAKSECDMVKIVRLEGWQ